jgi:hypothetical protein
MYIHPVRLVRWGHVHYNMRLRKWHMQACLRFEIECFVVGMNSFRGDSRFLRTEQIKRLIPVRFPHSHILSRMGSEFVGVLGRKFQTDEQTVMVWWSGLSGLEARCMMCSSTQYSIFKFLRGLRSTMISCKIGEQKFEACCNTDVIVRESVHARLGVLECRPGNILRERLAWGIQSSKSWVKFLGKNIIASKQLTL